MTSFRTSSQIGLVSMPLQFVRSSTTPNVNMMALCPWLCILSDDRSPWLDTCQTCSSYSSIPGCNQRRAVFRDVDGHYSLISATLDWLQTSKPMPWTKALSRCYQAQYRKFKLRCCRWWNWWSRSQKTWLWEENNDATAYELTKFIQSLSSLFPEPSRPTGEECETFTSRLDPIIQQMKTLGIADNQRAFVI